MTHTPLPFRPPPLDDELLSSWLARLAAANHCGVHEFCQYVGFGDGVPPDRVESRAAIDWRRLQRTLSVDQSAVRALQLPAGLHDPVRDQKQLDFIAPVRVQECRHCVIEAGCEIELRHWRWGGSIDCHRCGAPLTPTTAPQTVRGAITPKLLRRATEGAAYLNRAVALGDVGALRRARLAIRFSAAILGLRASWTVLFSSDRYARLSLLAALALSRRQPIRAAALSIANTPAGRRADLYAAFPERARAVRIIEVRADEHAAWASLNDHCHDTSEYPADTQPSDRFTVAAERAIADLGPRADERALMRRADQLL